MAKLKRTDVNVSSAGLMGMHGAGGDPAAMNILAEHGYDSLFHVSRSISEEMIEGADLIVVMENAHRQHLIANYPLSEEKIRLLKTFARDYDGVNQDIRDPYKQSTYHYRLCFSEIYMAIDGMLKCI